MFQSLRTIIGNLYDMPLFFQDTLGHFTDRLIVLNEQHMLVGRFTQDSLYRRKNLVDYAAFTEAIADGRVAAEED